VKYQHARGFHHFRGAKASLHLNGRTDRTAGRRHGARSRRLREGVRGRPRRGTPARAGLPLGARRSRRRSRGRRPASGRRAVESSGSAMRATRTALRCRCRWTRAASRRAATTSAAWWSTACATDTSSTLAPAGRSQGSRASRCSRRAV
jgi:hypothetical protein